jgi:hypothetical protein
MTVQEQFTEPEWKQVKDLAADAAMYVATAGKTGLIQMLKESTAAAKAIVVAKDSPDELVAAVGADLSDHDKSDKPVKPGEKMTTDQMHAYLLDQIKAAAALVTQKAPDHAQAYGEFIVDLAVKVSEAAKEGHHGPLVSDEEKAAIDELRAVLLPTNV